MINILNAIVLFIALLVHTFKYETQSKASRLVYMWGLFIIATVFLVGVKKRYYIRFKK